MLYLNKNLEKNLGNSREEHKEKQVLKYEMFKLTNVHPQAAIVSLVLKF